MKVKPPVLPPHLQALRGDELKILASKSFHQLEIEDLDAANGDLTSVTFDQVRLIRPQLTGAHWKHSRFQDVELRKIEAAAARQTSLEWQRAVIGPGRFSGFIADLCAFTDVEWGDCRFDQVTFLDCTFLNVRFRGCRFPSAVFDGCKFENVEFVECDLAGSEFRHGELRRSSMSNVDFRTSQLTGIGHARALAGATISTIQMIELAALLADAAGITVSDD